MDDKATAYHVSQTAGAVAWKQRRERVLQRIVGANDVMHNLPQTYALRCKKTQPQQKRFFVEKDEAPVPEEIAFITSIADSLKVGTRATKAKLLAIKEQTRELEQLLKGFTLITEGAELFVMKKIEVDCQLSWRNNNPKSHALYQELLDRLGQLTCEAQEVRLNALKRHLQLQEVQKIVAWGALTYESVCKWIVLFIKELVINNKID